MSPIAAPEMPSQAMAGCADSTSPMTSSVKRLPLA